MEIKDLLLNNNNFAIAEQIAKAIPYCRAEIEYNFWKALHNRYNDKMKALGIVNIYADYFDNDKKGIEEIFIERKRKKGEIFFEYKVREFKEQNLYLKLGYNGHNNNLYILIGIGKKNDYIPYKDYDIRVQNIINTLGFTKHYVCRYFYLNDDVNFHSESTLKIQDEDVFNRSVKSIGDEVLDTMHKVVNNKELMDLLATLY